MALLTTPLTSDTAPTDTPPTYWKIAPGENAHLWHLWLSEGVATIGWEELGDLTGLSRADFDARRDAVLRSHPDWTKSGVEQVWTFAHLSIGDRIVANRGISQVLGFGRVTGSYYFGGCGAPLRDAVDVRTR